MEDGTGRPVSLHRGDFPVRCNNRVVASRMLAALYRDLLESDWTQRLRSIEHHVVHMDGHDPGTSESV